MREREGIERRRVMMIVSEGEEGEVEEEEKEDCNGDFFNELRH